MDREIGTLPSTVCSDRRLSIGLVVPAVISMQGDLSQRCADNHVVVIFETDMKAEGVHVKCPRFAEVCDERNQAVEVVNFHAPM